MAGDPLQNRLHVPQIVDQVRKYDDVEGLAEIEFVNVRPNEPQMRVPLTRPFERFVREVDADAGGGLERGQQFPLAAAKVQNFLPPG